jgi:hypothetical protein
LLPEGLIVDVVSPLGIQKAEDERLGILEREAAGEFRQPFPRLRIHLGEEVPEGTGAPSFLKNREAGRETERKGVPSEELVTHAVHGADGGEL